MTEPGFPGPGAVPACDAKWELPGIVMTCGRVPEGRWRRGCVHEHVRDGFLCAKHAGSPATAFCRPCREFDGHLCPLSLVRIGEAAA